MPEASIIGWAHSPFGKLEAEPDLESLITRVARAAIEDAGISAAEIDAGFVGVFGEGFTPQGFIGIAAAAKRARDALQAHHAL